MSRRERDSDSSSDDDDSSLRFKRRKHSDTTNDQRRNVISFGSDDNQANTHCNSTDVSSGKQIRQVTCSSNMATDNIIQLNGHSSTDVSSGKRKQIRQSTCFSNMATDYTNQVIGRNSVDVSSGKKIRQNTCSSNLATGNIIQLNTTTVERLPGADSLGLQGQRNTSESSCPGKSEIRQIISLRGCNSNRSSLKPTALSASCVRVSRVVSDLKCNNRSNESLPGLTDIQQSTLALYHERPNGSLSPQICKVLPVENRVRSTSESSGTSDNSQQSRASGILAVTDGGNRGVLHNTTGRAVSTCTPNLRFELNLGSYSPDILTCLGTDVTPTTLEHFKSPFDWRCILVEGDSTTNSRGFYYGMGGTSVYLYDVHINRWKRVDLRIWMTKDTCVYGETVLEYNPLTRTTSMSFYIIDGLILGGEDIRFIHFTLRLETCAKFADRMNDESDPDCVPLKVKELIRMENLSLIFDKLSYQPSLIGPHEPANLMCPINISKKSLNMMQPAGVLFMKITRDPWVMALSRGKNQKYWFNTISCKSTVIIPETAIADFQYTLKNRMLWWWGDRSVAVLSPTLLGKTQLPPNVVFREQMVHHIQSLLEVGCL